MPKKLNLISSSPDNEWDKLVATSPYSSIFFHSSFLKNLLSCNLRHYKIFNEVNFADFYYFVQVLIQPVVYRMIFLL